MSRLRGGRFAREAEVDPFYDMLFNLLIAFVFCFIVALLSMNPKSLKAGDVPAKAEFILTLSWPDGDPNDIDTWVRDPAGEVVWFRRREAGLMHLERDDRGLANDVVEIDGKRIINPLNQEVVTIRGIIPGEYVVNAFYYPGDRSSDETSLGKGGPVPTTLSVVKINPKAEVVFNGQHTLQKPGEEFTLVRFTVLSNGGVTALNTLPAKLAQEF